MDFPENKLNLKRGTILEAAHPAVHQLGILVGDRILLGFDNEAYIRSGPFTWDVGQIVNEIEHGIWKVAGEMDLSDPHVAKMFGLVIEIRPVNFKEQSPEEQQALQEALPKFKDLLGKALKPQQRDP